MKKVLAALWLSLAISPCFAGDVLLPKGEYSGIAARDVEIAQKHKSMDTRADLRVKSAGGFNIVAPAKAFKNADLFAGENVRLESEDGVNFIAVKNSFAQTEEKSAKHSIKKEGKVFLAPQEES